MKRERFFLGMMGLAALLTRLSALSAVPLAADEAGSAWASWQAVHGGGWPATMVSPLLLHGNAALFFLFGGGDGIARLIPALGGALLVLTPWLWRRSGGTAVDAASFLLLFSPVALMASRRVEGTALAALALAVIAASLWEAVPTSLLAVAWAIGLTSGPLFWDGLLALTLAALTFDETLPALRSRAFLQGVLWGFGGAVLISLALGWHWHALAGPMAGAAAWIHSWRDGLFPMPRLLFLVLLATEPLTLFLASYAWVRGRASSRCRFLLLWAMGALSLLLLHTSTPRALLLVLLPAALAAGEGVAALSESELLPWPGPWVQEATYGVLGAFIVLLLARSTTALATGQETVLIVLVVAVGTLLYVGFLLTGDLGFATRALVRGVALLALFFQVGAATMGYLRADAAAEPLSWPTVSPDLRTLAAMTTEYSRLYAVTPEKLAVVVLDGVPDEAAVLWSLREFPALRTAASAPEGEEAVVITSPDHRPAGRWQGMAVTAASRLPSLSFPDARALAAWLLYRRPPASVELEKVILWWPAREGR